MQGNQGFLVTAGNQAFQCAPVALQLVDGARLFAAFIHAQHQTAVHQLFVDVARGGGHQQRDRAFNTVLLRNEIAGHRVFAGAGDGEFAFGLQQLQGIAGAGSALFFHYRQRLVFQVGFAHVEQALAGHSAVFHFVFFGHEGQHRVHQAAFTGCAR